MTDKERLFVGCRRAGKPRHGKGNAPLYQLFCHSAKAA